MRRHACLSFLSVATLCCLGIASASTAENDDEAVLGYCLDAIYKDAHAQTPAPPLRVVHVWPEGMRSSVEVPKSQLAHELPGLDWSLASTAIDHVYQRTATHWNPPATMSLPDVRVEVREPPRKRRWYKTAFFVTFWPPGYSDDRGFAVVLASFGPSDHGSRAACQLRKLNAVWSVEKKWVLSYL